MRAVPPTSEHVRQALARWKDFPVHQEPRPIIVTDLGIAGSERLREDERWRAQFDGPAEPGIELPPEILPAATRYCRDVHTGAERPLARVIRADGPFGTDRGVRELPAWMMYPRDRRWPFIALDPEFGRRRTWWPAGLRNCGDDPSTLADDGRTLTYRFTGTLSAYAAYPDARVFETGTAVLVEPVEVDLDPGGYRVDIAEQREVVVRLAAPLGNRVLVGVGGGAGQETCGAPRTVLRSGQSR